MITRSLFLLLWGAVVLQVGPVSAQSARGSIGAGAVLEIYRFDDPEATGIEELALLTTPLAFRAPLGRRLALDFVGTFARGELRRADGSKTVLSGLTDTQVTLSAALVPDRFSLSLVALLPTGKQEHTDAEAEVAGAISADLLPFRISNWSTGGGVGLSSAIAHSAGPIGFGVSASYVLGREFDVLETEEFAYRPGDQLVVRGVLDANLGTASKLALQLTYQRASEDQVNGSNLFRPGSRFLAMTSYSFAIGGTGSAIMYGGLYHRSHGAYLLDPAPDDPVAEDLWLAGGGMRIPLGGAVLQPSVDVRIVRRENGRDQGYGIGFGTTLELGRSGGVTVIPLVRGRVGNVLVREDVETSFTGLDAGLILRFGGPR